MSEDLVTSAAPAAVRAPDDSSNDNISFSVDDLRNLLSNAVNLSGGTAATTATKRGAINLGDIANPKASAKANNGTITKLVGQFRNLDEFGRMLSASGTAAKLDEAAASGKMVTLFAPTNDAMASMKDMALVKLNRDAKLAPARKALMQQHAVINMDEEYTQASAQYGVDMVGAAIETLQEGAHISIQEDTDSPHASAHLAVQHDDDGTPTAASRIQGSYSTPEGHTIHFLSQALV